MDTLQFFQAILPPQGVYYLGLMQAGRTGVGHRSFSTLEELAHAVEVFNTKPDITVYHACGTYKEACVETNGKKQYRIASNTRAAKSLWIDIDCGPDKAASGKGYATKSDAGRALLLFCQKTGFPAPLIVDSGRGIHAYWPFTQAIPSSDWRVLAAQFKIALAHFDVIADPTRTADFASILRPVGSHNKKDPNNHKVVKVLREAPAVDVSVIMAALSNIVSNFDVDLLGPAPAYATDENDDLTAHLPPPIPSDANLVATKCAQVALLRDTGGAGYEQWFKVIGVLSHCFNGNDAAHQWSSQSPSYTHAETEQKIDSWNAGPSTCDAFDKINPAGCAGCIYKGKVKTPLVLGRIETPAEPAKLVEAKIDDEVVQVLVPQMPDGYKVGGVGSALRMYREIENKDGVKVQRQFAYLLFYPTTRICIEDGTFCVRIRVHKPKGEIEDFDIPSSTVAVGGHALITELGHKEIMHTSNKDASGHITAYMQQSLQNLLETTKQINTMTAFGWQSNKDSFLLGDRLYRKDGSVQRVILGGHALSRSKSLPAPMGTSEGWTTGVNTIYHREGMEPMQYALCSAFGSILTPFGEDLYHGIPVALTGSESGKGKTTVCHAALYAFGDATKMSINGPKGATDNARWAIMGAMRNIPMLLDEITHIKAQDLSEMLYAASNGQDKERMKSGAKGVVIADQNTWDMSMYMTANKHLSLVLASEKGNSEAESVRFIEIQTDTYQIPSVDTLVVGAALNKISLNAGCAGAEYVARVVTMVDSISDRFIAMSERLAFSSRVSSNSQYRYYRQHAVCTLVAAEIMAEMGLVAFDTEALFTWTINHITKICADVIEFNTLSGEEATQRMLVDMSPMIITTATYKDGRVGVAPDVVKLNVPPVGRYITGTSNGSEVLAGRVYVSKAAVRDWCLKNRVDLNAIPNYLVSIGAMGSKNGVRFNITKGTSILPAQLVCFDIDSNRMTDALAGVPFLQLHSNHQEAA